MWDIIKDWNWELIIALGALALSMYTFYVQNVKEELVIYPYENDKKMYITIENTGKSLIRNYTLELSKVEHMDAVIEKQLKKMFLFQRKVKFNLAANRSINFSAGSTAANNGKEFLPILTFDVYNSKKRKVDTFVCDFNMYRHQMTIVVHSTKEQRKDALIQEISQSLSGIHDELAKKNKD